MAFAERFSGIIGGGESSENLTSEEEVEKKVDEILFGGSFPSYDDLPPAVRERFEVYEPNHFVLRDASGDEDPESYIEISGRVKDEAPLPEGVKVGIAFPFAEGED